MTTPSEELKVALPERSCDDGCNGCEDCTDYDEDCESVKDKVACWLYAPENGLCPYLRRGK